jgi:hypothetical protein
MALPKTMIGQTDLPFIPFQLSEGSMLPFTFTFPKAISFREGENGKTRHGKVAEQ